MTLVVRDEADILEDNLRYHLAQGVDFILATDHASSDGTTDILERYARDGVLAYERDSTEGHRQKERVNRMVRLAAERYSADWVINNDADEFWWPVVGSLRDLFGAIPAGFGQVIAPRHNFLPTADRQGPFYRELVYRERASVNTRGLPLEPKVAFRPLEGIESGEGNHFVIGEGCREVPTQALAEIFHFPMRDYDQFERKVVKVGTGYEQLPAGEVRGQDQMLLLEQQRSGQLGAYWEQNFLARPAIEARLSNGTLVLDDRLRIFMDRLDGERGTANPGSETARQLLEWSFSGLEALADSNAELERCRWDLARKLEELDSAKGQIATLGDQVTQSTGAAAEAHRELTQLREHVSQLQEQAASSRRERDDAVAGLESLRNSRMLRWTRPARRAYYRLLRRRRGTPTGR